MTESGYKRGCFYRYDGAEFVELEPSQETKIPVSEEAAKAVKAARKAAHQHIGMRPELSLTASAMLLAAAELPDLSERIAVLGVELYSRRNTAVAEPDAASPVIEASATADATIATAATEAATAVASAPVSAYLD